MTSRPNESSGMNPCTRSDARPEQVTSQEEIEGCPVIEKSGAICGETRTLRIFQDFRQIYDDCIRKMESNREENLALRKLAPFKKLVEDLWEQNAMLVETVEELEQEATCRVVMLQNKLDQCSEKDLENLLKQKDREICSLRKDISNKNELLGKYCNQIEELKREMKARDKRIMEMDCRMRETAMQKLCQAPTELNEDEEEFNESAIEILFNEIVKEMDKQKSKLMKQIEEADCIVEEMTREKSKVLNEKSDLRRKLEDIKTENCSLKNELAEYKSIKAENEELLNSLEQSKDERDRLQNELNCLHHNMQELDKGFKETRWALTAEIAEKHDQILELKRNLACLEEQMRQADMKTLFKDDVIKEMRKELKNSRAVVCAMNNLAKTPLKDPPNTADAQSLHFDVPVKENSDEDIKLDIRIFPVIENQDTLVTEYSKYSSESCSLKIQADKPRKSLSKMRNVSTQHTTRVLKLPRSVGTLKVMPWSGASGEGTVCNSQPRFVAGHSKNHKGTYHVPCSSQS